MNKHDLNNEHEHTIPPPFSVLMSVYYKENPQHLELALESIYTKQSLKPDEIIIIKDGKLTQQLDMVIENFKNALPNIVKIHDINKNRGLGNALKIGVELCKNELIARMDSDDISDDFRFEKQIRFLAQHPEVDVLGSQIQEFRNTCGDLNRQRNVPTENDEIRKFAKLRSPMNHPSVIFKKSKVLLAGNYQNNLLLWEDYMLWVKMLAKGFIFHNLNESLLFFRVNNMISRRRGKIYAKGEVKFALYAFRSKFFSVFDFLRYLFLRPIIRLLPENMLLKLYSILHK